MNPDQRHLPHTDTHDCQIPLEISCSSWVERSRGDAHRRFFKLASREEGLLAQPPRTDISTRVPQPSGSWQARVRAMTGKIRQRKYKARDPALYHSLWRCWEVGAGRIGFGFPGMTLREAAVVAAARGGSGGYGGHQRRCTLAMPKHPPAPGAGLDRPHSAHWHGVTAAATRRLLYVVLGPRSGDV
jgi:hypothetical protein